MIGYLCKSLRIISLVWPTRLIFLAMGEVLSFGFNLVVSFPSDSRGSKARIVLLLRESWIRGCPDGRTIPTAGLLDYEDTRLKTLSRVRKGLSLAWKASLAIRICRSPTIVTDFV